MLYIKDPTKKKKKLQLKVQIYVQYYNNKTTKIMVNQFHALIFSEKKDDTIIGVLVKDLFIYFIITWLRLRQHKDMRSFPLKICNFEKLVKKKRNRDLLNNHIIMNGNFESLTM